MVIPCCDRWQFSPEVVKCVQAQTIQDFEIIIVNDGSSDPLTLDQAAANDQQSAGPPGTRVFHTENRGYPAARNRGIKESRGKYICALNADDHLEPRWFEAAVEVLDQDSEVTFASHWYRTSGDQQREWTPQRCDLLTVLDRNTVSSAALVRRQALFDAGLFDESMGEGCEAWDLWLTLLEHGHRGVILPRVFLQSRRLPDSMGRHMSSCSAHIGLSRTLIEKHADSYRTHLLELYQRRELEICDLRRRIYTAKRARPMDHRGALAPTGGGPAPAPQGLENPPQTSARTATRR